MGINPITNIGNLGLHISLRAKNNLKLASFFLKHKIRNRIVAVPTDITFDSVRILREIKESKKEHKDPLVSPVIDTKNWPKTMESLKEYLRVDILVKGVPISYVVRSKEAVAASPDESATSFLSDGDEMVARSLILKGGLRTATFKTEMMKVWGMISAITRVLDF